MNKHVHIYLGESPITDPKAYAKAWTTADDWAAWNEQHKGQHHATHAEAHKALGAHHAALEKAGFVHHKSEGHPDEAGGHTNHLKHANGSTAKVTHIARPSAEGGGHHVMAHVKEKESHKPPKAPPAKPAKAAPAASRGHGGGKAAKHIFVALKKGAKEVKREVDRHEREVGKK